MTLRHTLIFVAILFVMCLVAGSAFAAGGAFVDNLQITNNGAMVFSDDFNTGKLDSWKDAHDASSVAVDAAGKDFALNLNQQGTQKAFIAHDLGMKVEGTVELKAKIEVTGPDMQANYEKHMPSALEFWLAGDGTASTVRALVVLRPKETLSRVGMMIQGTEKGKPFGIGAGPKKPVLPPNTWATLTLRLDRGAKTVTVLMNDKEMGSKPYDPDAFKEIRALSIVCSYGVGRDPNAPLIPGRP